MYVSKDQKKAVLFAFDIHPRYAEKLYPVRLNGLDPNKMYRVNEINKVQTMPMRPGMNNPLDNKVYSGDYLMTVGLNLFSTRQLNSRVIEIVAE
jgi:alpha-galactosidase